MKIRNVVVISLILGLSVLGTNIGSSVPISMVAFAEETPVQKGFKEQDGKLYFYKDDGTLYNQSGIYLIDGKKYYIREDGSVLQGKGFVEENGHTYYISENGIMTGRQTLKGKEYFFSNEGTLVKSEFFKENNSTFYTNEEGALASRWNKIDGKVYYFNPVYHFMLTDGRVEINGKPYLFTEDGTLLGPNGVYEYRGNIYHANSEYVLSRGLVDVAGEKYFFQDNYTGVRNQLYKINGKMYLFDEVGRMRKKPGLNQVGASIYLMDQDGSLLTGFRRYQGSLYYFNPVYGFGLKSGTAEINGQNYLFKEDGKILEGKGFVKEGDKTYYIGDKGLVTGPQVINGKKFLFSSAGVLAKTGFITEKNNTKYYVKGDGSLATGWIRIDGKLYYFNPVYNFMLWGGIAEINGKSYLFTDDGYVLGPNNVLEYKGNLYHSKNDYSLSKGKVKVGTDSYFFENNFKAVRGSSHKDNGKIYLYDSNGKMINLGSIGMVGKTLYGFNSDGSLKTGWQKINQKRYYFNPVYGFGLKSGTAEIGGINYLFREDGSILEGKGFVKEGENTYYISDKGVVTGLQTINGKKYIFSKEGILAKPGFFKEDDKSFFISEVGSLASGWRTIEGQRYYFEPKTYVMYKNAAYEINGKAYLFLPEGPVNTDRGLVHQGSDTYFVDQSGKLVTGKIKVENIQYYFGTNDYKAIKDKTIFLDGNLYYFSSEGHMEVGYRGLKTLNNSVYLFGNKGELKTGWQYVDGKKYYFNPVFGWGLKGGEATFNNETYLFNEDGSVYKGWREIGKKLYYYDQTNGYKYKNMAITVDGVIRLFSEDGTNIRQKGLHRVGGYEYYVGDKGEVYNNREFIYNDRRYTALGTHVFLVSKPNHWDVYNGIWYRYDGSGKIIDQAKVGSNFVIISVDHQRMWVYNHGKEVVSTPVVTGWVGRHDTPRGHWAVWDKSSPTPLIPDCRYWLAFQSINGIHDAPWRHWFGGNRYLFGGSHGCVNTPPHIMPTVYNNVFLRTPVIVY